MNEKLIYGRVATLEELYMLYAFGFSFVVEDGAITEVLHSGRIDK